MIAKAVVSLPEIKKYLRERKYLTQVGLPYHLA
jgi:hypothetical protein